MPELKPCPLCKGIDLTIGAYSVSDECYISCSCGLSLTLSVPWKKNMTEKEHDKACIKKLTKKWNKRVDNE